MPEIEQPSWNYDFKMVSMRKETNRASVPAGVSPELVGFDGSLEGQLRPHPGFKWVTDLTYGFGASEYGGGTLDGRGTFLLRVDRERSAYGVVYRVKSGGQEQIRVKFRFDNSLVWETDAEHGFTTGLVGSRAESGQMTVLVSGRFCWVLCKGAEPILFYFVDADGSSISGGYALTVDNNLGAMKAPELVNPNPNACCVRSRSDTAGAPHPDMQEVLYSWTVPTDLDVPASAKVLYWGFSDVETVSNDNITYITNPFLSERAPGGGGVTAECIRGPSDLRLPDNTLLWASPPQPDPTFDDAKFYDTTGAYVSPTYSYPATEGENEGLSYQFGARNIEDEEPVGLPPTATFRTADGYVWAYQLYDSRTGRYSSLSPRLLSSPNDGTGRVAQYYVYWYNDAGDYVFQEWWAGTFPMLDIVYQHERFDTLLLFRGTLTQGLQADEVTMALDGVFSLSDYQTDAQPGDTTWKRSCVFSITAEGEIAYKQAFTGSDVWLEDMPQAGSAIFHEGTLLIGNIKQFDREIAGSSLVRWSDLFTTAYELFRPTDRYILRMPNEEVLRFVGGGPNVIGLTRSTVYLFRRESYSFKGYALHRGYAIANPYAAAEVASDIYFITRRGMKIVYANGSLGEVASLNYLLKEEWAASLDSVEMVHDEQMGTLTLLNPTSEEIVQLWFDNSKITMLHDCFFKHVCEGWVPNDLDSVVDEESNPIESRAVFFQEVQSESAQVFWRISVMDKDREKTGYSFLDHVGTRRASIAISIPGSSTTLAVPFTVSDSNRHQGCYVYVLSGTHRGEKARIVRKGVGNTFILATALPSLAVGTRIGISPVYCRAVGHPLGLVDPTGIPFGNDIFRRRQLNSLGASFVDVQGDAATDSTNKDAKFTGFAYTDATGDITKRATPAAPDGTDVISVVDGESIYEAAFRHSTTTRLDGVVAPILCPGIEVYCPDLDFKLLGMRGSGRITTYVKSEPPRT